MGKKLALSIGVSAIALAVAGCEQGPMAERAGSEATAAADRPAADRLVERDVEAPEVFSETETALWDGRPSLGGVWVAHPDVQDPERVMIRNADSGKVVIGALFRRERENPGPRFQVSSDAAAALELLAGQPTELSVVALRRREVAAPAEPGEAATLDAPETVETQTLAPARAIAEEPAITPAGAAPAQTGTEIAEAGPAAAAGAENAPASGRTAAAEPQREGRGLFGRLFGRDAAQAPASAPASASGPVSAEARAAAAALPEGVEVASLEPSPAAARTDAPTPQPPASSLDRPFVQIGIFSVEENARRTAEALRRNGVVPRISAEESQGRAFWRVVAGPTATAQDRATLIAKVKRLGFTDAYAVPD